MSRTTVLGTVVVERVVDTVMVVAIAALAVVVLSVRGVMSSAVLLGRRVRVAAGHRFGPRDGRPPAAGCGPRHRDHRALAARPRARPPAARGPRRRRPAANARGAPSPSAPSPGPPRPARSWPPARRSASSCRWPRRRCCTSGVALVTIVPSGPGYRRDVRADGRRDRRGLRHLARRRVRARLAGPPDDPGHDLDRRRDRDARDAAAQRGQGCLGRGRRGTAPSGGGR